MPSIPLEIEVEIYCDTCGSGLCNRTDYVRTRNRQEHSFRVEACDECIDKAVEKAVENKESELQEIIDDLRDQIENLKESLKEANEASN